MTIELQMMDERAARKVTEQIRISAHNYSEARTKLMERVQEAKNGNAHIALKYASWTAYLAEVLGEEPMRLARDERQDMVKMLANEGMSSRAIAPIVGASPAQVKRDVRGGSFEPPAPENVDTSTGEIHDEPKPVTGMDGKEYRRPDPVEHKPRPEALTSQFTGVVTELNRVLDKFYRISENKNFPNNKNQIATLHGSDLARAISELNNLADALN